MEDNRPAFERRGNDRERPTERRERDGHRGREREDRGRRDDWRGKRDGNERRDDLGRGRHEGKSRDSEAGKAAECDSFGRDRREVTAPPTTDGNASIATVKQPDKSYTQSDLNKLEARLLKAELKGDSALVTSLQAEIALLKDHGSMVAESEGKPPPSRPSGKITALSWVFSTVEISVWTR